MFLRIPPTLVSIFEIRFTFKIDHDLANIFNCVLCVVHLYFYSFLTLRDNKLFNMLFVSNLVFPFTFKIDHDLANFAADLVTNIDLDLIVDFGDKDD